VACGRGKFFDEGERLTARQGVRRLGVFADLALPSAPGVRRLYPRRDSAGGRRLNFLCVFLLVRDRPRRLKAMIGPGGAPEVG